MKQVIAKAGKVEVVEVPAPTCGPDELLVRTAYSLISTGTESWTIGATEPIAAKDLMENTQKLKKAVNLARDVLKKEGLGGLIDYTKAVRNPQVPLGYSLSGVVIEVGRNVTDIVVGDRVACAGEGKACHAEFASVPRNLTSKVPGDVGLRDASFTTVGAIAVHGFRRSGAQLGESVGVVGSGLVGNLVIQVAKAAGCRVVAMDLKDVRLQLAKEAGADLVLSPTDPLLDAHISQFTEGRGLDSVLVCAATTSSDPVNLAARIARDRAKVTVVGRVGMDFERKDYYQKELGVEMSRSLGPGRYDPVYEEKGIDYPVGYVRWTLNRNMDAFLKLLEQKKVNVETLVGEVYPVQDASSAYSALEGEAKVAVLLSYESRSEPTRYVRAPVSPKTAKGDRINVALVGPGNYAKEILIPLLRSNSQFNLRWVISSSPLHSKQLAERYHFENHGTDYSEVLSDSKLDLVAITTPNNLHYQMVLDAANAGKSVFVEKPLCISEEELRDLQSAQNRTGATIVVGFNRRYAPLILRLKKEMNRRDGPFLLNYRVNADYIPMSRWTQDPRVGGGRIIAECCHFFDLFNFLLGKISSEMRVTSAGVTNSTTLTRDNIIAVLKYPEGSVASLTYSALGNRSMGRERLEVFGQGTAFVLDDFESLTIHEPSRTSTLKSNGQDKGHRSEISEIARMLRGESSSVISFEEAVSAMETTFAAERAVRSAQNPPDISAKEI
ncbi:MAG: Gfo/Idh/MocA family oxidoreductase [Nitrososphaerales archaeon]|jgi:predicted dehydrogenase/threonine dehydrogenase-like Zn-dependent dehydrogenase